MASPRAAAPDEGGEAGHRRQVDLRIRDKIRIGIVGCGRVTRSAHVAALQGLPGFEIVALADRDLALAKSLSSGLPSALCHVTHEELIARDDVDVVAVCVPAGSHAEVAACALEAGKHVFLEKPLALDLDDGMRIANAARHARGKLVVGFNLRFHRLVEAGREIVSRGLLGEVDALLTHYTSDHRLLNPDHPWRPDRTLGGGVLNEIAPHHIDLWHYLHDGEIVEVHTLSRDAGWDDDVAAITARWQDGALASGLFGQRTLGTNEVQVFGTEASLAISLYRFDGLALRPRRGSHRYATALARAAARALRELPRGIVSARYGGEHACSYRREWQHVEDVIRRGASVGCTAGDGLRALEVTAAARESALARRPVSLETVRRKAGSG